LIRPRSSRRSLGLAGGLLLGALVTAAFGWGYWRVSSHGDLQVQLYDVALASDRQLYGVVLAADLIFNDANGNGLARGRAEKPWGVVSLLHPEAGDCRKEEREGGAAWQGCFAAQSRWLMTWVRQVRHATVRLDSCIMDQVPVQREESRDAWWLWWVPHPHLDNSTRTHFKLSLWIDSSTCQPARPPADRSSNSG
jgi:hypothetical protein